jgi:hypothetical protein
LGVKYRLRLWPDWKSSLENGEFPSSTKFVENPLIGMDLPEIFCGRRLRQRKLPEAKNDDSLVLRLHYRNRDILLPGDAEKQAEHAILEENKAEALRADVLKVGHHGGKNSTTLEFLAAVQPRVAIISVGEKNTYGHPSSELLKRLEAVGVRILRTDRDGAVQVLTDGERLEISCFVACTEARATAASVQANPADGKQDSKKQ